MSSKPKLVVTDFRTSFDKMAEIMANKATQPDTPFAEITEAFKVMTAYYALTLKHREALPDDADGFDFTKDIEETNGSRVPGRRSS